VHNNYYFLRQISAGLALKLKGFTLVSCFSQSKDELVIEFNNAKSSLFIRASLLPEFSCLTFPARFQRARKNSVDLFNQLLMKTVTGVRQFSNERSFAIDLEGELSLVFLMHGNRSNVLMAEIGRGTDVFKSSQENDLNIVLEELNREIDWSREAFEKNIGSLDKLYFTFGKPVWLYLRSKGFFEAEAEQKWQLIRETLQILENPERYFITGYSSTTHLALVPYGTPMEDHIDPFEAVNNFASTHASRSQFQKKREQATSRARQEVKSATKYVEVARARLDEIEAEDHFKVWGDVLMANLHQVAAGAKSVSLENFYDNYKVIEIPLDEKSSPQKNAERYYRKSKNRTIEIGKLKEAIARFELKLQVAEKNLVALTGQTDHHAIQSLLDKEENQSQSDKETLPFWAFEYKSFTIWAGRDAKNNDELTMRWARKNDLWLHARDVPGSHVIVRHQAGKPFPKDVIEYAASIAAWNSKRKTESLCPVIVTPRKFVRKKKGAPAGAVIVEREEVVLVEPKQPTTNN
jgi:hypothetical protein